MNTKTCFVVMPFGNKLNIDGRLLEGLTKSMAEAVPLDTTLAVTIDFDAVYETIIKPAIGRSRFEIESVRCDEIPGAGSIHADMFRHIYQDDVVIVDISTLNANVFYELGIRHALRPAVTVLIQRRGTQAPFNITGFRVIDYDEAIDPEPAISELAAFIDEGLNNPDRNHSPVFLHLPQLASRRPVDVIPRTERITYVVAAQATKIGLITGDIQNIRDIDVWVNSENTNMQMARFHERGVSGVIRWLGASKKRTGRVTEDCIAEALRELMDGDSEVDAGTVLPTTSGELLRTHGVKQVFHAAAVEGQVGHGYRPVADVAACITNALELMDDPEFDNASLESILFPLIGTGSGGSSVKDSIATIIAACLAYLDRNPRTRIKEIYLIARTTQQLAAGTALLDATPGLERAD